MYVPISRNIISSYDVVLDRSVSSALEYTPQPSMDMRPAVSYTTYATYLKEQTGDIITFSQFGEGNVLSEACDNSESGD